MSPTTDTSRVVVAVAAAAVLDVGGTASHPTGFTGHCISDVDPELTSTRTSAGTSTSATSGGRGEYRRMDCFKGLLDAATSVMTISMLCERLLCPRP